MAVYSNQAFLKSFCIAGRLDLFNRGYYGIVCFLFFSQAFSFQERFTELRLFED